MRLRTKTAEALARPERWAESTRCERCGTTLLSARPIDFGAVLALHRRSRRCHVTVEA
ncbi:MAG TPA: hypothetical protein VFH45_00895 [Acidimicrobiales bacterium]|nr:hypothetical protein [Acidimicrobiales bacterium]